MHESQTHDKGNYKVFHVSTSLEFEVSFPFLHISVNLVLLT